MTGRSPAAGSLLSGPLPGFAGLCAPFVHGTQMAEVWPLERYVSSVHPGSAIHLIRSKVRPGSHLLEPFGSSPQIAYELAAAGYAVTVCMFNPVVRWLLESACETPSRAEAAGWLDQLGSAARGETTFASFIQSFYVTTCRSCNKPAYGAEYLWTRGSTVPRQVLVACPLCGNQWVDCDEQDHAILHNIERNPTFRTLAVGRITSCGQGLEQDALDLVDAHNSRALFILHAIIGRLKVMDLPARGRQVLRGLLLEVLDQATALWPVDDPQLRPRMLTVPGEYIEKNLWMKLMNSVTHPFHPAGRVRLVYHPVDPDPGEICLFPGRARDLISSPGHKNVDCLVCVIPRPNQAFWKLCSAWSAWLLEREESSAFLKMISRDRYDWGWHTRALAGLATMLRQKLDPPGGVYGFLAEVEPPLISAVLPAFQEGGWKLDGFALDVQSHQAQLHWVASEGSHLRQATAADIGSGAVAYLRYKGEPADYLEMTCAGLLQLQQDGSLLSEQEDLSRQGIVKQGISSPLRFMHFGSGGQTMESGAWWLAHSTNHTPSFSDALELFTLERLNEQISVSADEISSLFRRSLPAIWVDSAEYIQAVLKSYAARKPDGSWQITEKENNSNRSEVVIKLHTRIRDLGVQLGYLVEGDDPIKWMENNGRCAYEFHIQSHTAFCGQLLRLPGGEGQRILVLPASRLDLLAYKQKNLPGMRQLLTENWLIVKFRLISRLLDNPFTSKEKFEELIHSDPADINPDQLFLF